MRSMPPRDPLGYLWFALTVIFNVGLVYLGLTWFVPSFGVVGYAWLVIIIAVFAFNTYRFFTAPQPPRRDR